MDDKTGMTEGISYTDYFSGGNKKKGSNNILNGKEEMSIERRVKLLEEKNNALTKRIEILEQNDIVHFRKIKSQLEVVESDNKSFKNQVKDMNDKIQLMIEELKSFAKKGDVVEMKKYVELLNPMDFVTEREVHEIISRKIEEYLRNNYPDNDIVKNKKSPVFDDDYVSNVTPKKSYDKNKSLNSSKTKHSEKS